MNDRIDIKLIRSLSQKIYRDETGLFVAEGEKMVQEALNSPFNVVSVIRKEEAGEKIMSRISMMSSPSPCLAVIGKPSDSEISDEKIHEYVAGHGLYLALDSIRDPGNLGTIIRTADWFGIKKIVLSQDTCDPWQHKVIQSSMGSIFRTNIIETDIIQFLKEINTPVFGALMQGKNVFHTNIKQNQGVIIIGSESHGIRENVMPFISCPINIPRAKGSATESLNASIAAGIIMAEVFRKNL